MNGRTKNSRVYTGSDNNAYHGGESDTNLYCQHKRHAGESGGIGAKTSGMRQSFPIQAGSFLYARKSREVITITETKLMKMEYYDYKAETRLETYADTVVIEKDGYTSYIAAIRFGGYPESVKGMSEAIFGGGSVKINIDGTPITLYSRVKQYRKEFSHDGIYAEATLMIRDEEHRNDGDEDGGDVNSNSKPRKCYLFCEQGDSSRLFEELDKKTAVPLIPEFKDYFWASWNTGIY